MRSHPVGSTELSDQHWRIGLHENALLHEFVLGSMGIKWGWRDLRYLLRVSTWPRYVQVVCLQVLLGTDTNQTHNLVTTHHASWTGRRWLSSISARASANQMSGQMQKDSSGLLASRMPLTGKQNCYDGFCSHKSVWSQNEAFSVPNKEPCSVQRHPHSKGKIHPDSCYQNLRRGNLSWEQNGIEPE